MPLMRLVLRGGVDITRTASRNNDTWVASNLIRWRESLPESLLGFFQFCAQRVNGVARAIHYWADLAGVGRLAVGTNTNLYVEQNGALADITPTSNFTQGSASSGINPPF